MHDRVVIQEVIKNLASTARLGADNTSAKRFKGLYSADTTSQYEEIVMGIIFVS